MLLLWLNYLLIVIIFLKKVVLYCAILYVLLITEHKPDVSPENIHSFVYAWKHSYKYMKRTKFEVVTAVTVNIVLWDVIPYGLATTTML